MVETTTRTLVTHPRNHKQVKRQIDPHAWSASKLWNSALYQLYEWLDNHNLPSEDLDTVLKREFKDNEHYNGLHSQSSQQVLEELSDAFNNWLNSDDSRDNPPSYRKQWYHDNEGRLVHEEHPRSTVTWKSRPFGTMSKTIESAFQKAQATNPRLVRENTFSSTTRNQSIVRLARYHKFEPFGTAVNTKFTSSTKWRSPKSPLVIK